MTFGFLSVIMISRLAGCANQPASAFAFKTSRRWAPRASRIWSGEVAEVAGSVEKVVFRAPSGFTVTKLRLQDHPVENYEDDGGKKKKQQKRPPLVTVVSSTCSLLATAVPGDALICRGEWLENPKFGRQLQVLAGGSRPLTMMVGGDQLVEGSSSSSTAALTPLPPPPTPGEAARVWLLSGALPGIGPATTERIVELFGDETTGVLEQLSEPEFDPRLVS
jgi:hypothetical protein